MVATNDSVRSLPLAVLAGKTTETVPSKVRWVYGDLLIPKACCDQYFYRVNSFGNFYLGRVDDSRSIDKAVSVYLDTLLFGICAAILVYRDLLSGIQRNPDPVTGTTLMIGTQRLEWPVLATPIKRPPGDRNMIVSQAELFRGQLNVRNFLTSSLDCLVFDSRDENVPVIIKASSVAVHRTLVLPDVVFMAMSAVHSVLRSPLLASVWMDAGLITVMDDLTQQGYGILNPKSGFSTNLAWLWKGFMALVTTVLLPFAERGVVHADIRPGFDFTVNILFILF